MLTKQQQRELEQAVLGFLISKKYYQTASSLAQESPSLCLSEAVQLSDWPEASPAPSQIQVSIFPGNESSLGEEKTDQLVENIKVRPVRGFYK